ncbi:MAG: DUF6157 family protein [Galactobacter sp.]
MGTTNYKSTFIQVADDNAVTSAQIPPSSDSGPSIAELEYQLLSEHPYGYTSDDLLFEVYALRHGIPDADREESRTEFFAKAQACLRASPLAKRYGWGFHHDADGKVALVGVGTDRYAELVADPALDHVKAMRSSRAAASA